MTRQPRVPQRTCIACRQVGGKPGLLRVVRTPQGEVRLDDTGKLPGRGAYLHRQRACLEQAIARRQLTRALGVPIGDDIVLELRQRLAESLDSAPGPEKVK